MKTALTIAGSDSSGGAGIQADLEAMTMNGVLKIGMVASSGLIEVIAERLQHYGAKNIVVDPVMVATSGARLISEDAIATLEARLLPLATVLTPNIPEAEVLS